MCPTTPSHLCLSWILLAVLQGSVTTTLIVKICFFLPQQNPSAQAALQAAQALVNQSDTQGGPNTVLRVIVEHMIYPVTLDVLYQVSQAPLCSDVKGTTQPRGLVCVCPRLLSSIKLRGGGGPHPPAPSQLGFPESDK